MSLHFLIVGSGFSGAVLANQLTQALDCKVDIWDERPHAGGNCHTERDEQTGIMVHQYGPHIFNTDKKEIWDYVNSFGEFKHYVHRVKALSKGAIYSLPVSLFTINQFFGKTFTPAEAKEFLQGLADKTIIDPQNFEEQALHFIGRELYDAFFYGYTKKQWGCEPTELPASIIKRIPVRFNYDDNYHTNEYTGIPVDGYSAIMQKMIDHPSISLTLNKKFTAGMDTSQYTHVFYTGPLDAYFEFEYGRLGYRTVTFEKFYAEGDHQGLSQMNYCDEEVPYTRVVEHKHFTPWEKHQKTVYFKEFSKETGPADEPYYPKRLQHDKGILKQYRAKAESLSGVSFLGRLATYRYMDMHHVIGEALSFAENFVKALKTGQPIPVFSNTEEL
ncbi:UDP-galactopyranose mutase [Ferruginibacter sp. HRS2-29]|uniref:UDP-galactopyranose mutase n=1 Tax=Ferruginibacter sp. HRS2-29 TaxID=2487334 RepID=UPI0020CE15CF|nr:UDP-galactopyranose mutase [Ferruginibacter sp. HRS2-29]MCP9749927.1 UDP-galactopyranose mutase [Ferruginibacter sp. HRS2-29]